MKYLIVGLGNIGSEYENTRHNIGFDICDEFVKKNSEENFSIDRLASICKVKYRGKQVFVIKPTTYMNLSGKAIKYWMTKEKISIENVLVLVDDLALPIAKIRVRKNGSSAGHNGLKSIELELGTQVYNRLKFGIGNDFPKGRQVDFVLGKWTNSEFGIIKENLLFCCEAIECFIQQGIITTMNKYN